MIAKSRIFMLFAATVCMTLSLAATPAQQTTTQTDTTKEPAMKVTCSADPAKITQGQESPIVTVTATVEQKVESPLTYTWSATAGAKVDGKESVVTIDATDLRPGLYIVRVKVDDDKKNSVICRSTFTLAQAEQQQPQKEGGCPTVAITASPQTVEAGLPGNVTLHATTAGTKEGQKVTYKWSTDKGEIKGEGETVSLDTTSLEAGDLKITVVGNDGKCSFTNSVGITKK